MSIIGTYRAYLTGNHSYNDPKKWETLKGFSLGMTLDGTANLVATVMVNFPQLYVVGTNSPGVVFQVEAWYGIPKRLTTIAGGSVSTETPNNGRSPITMIGNYEIPEGTENLSFYVNWKVARPGNIVNTGDGRLDNNYTAHSATMTVIVSELKQSI